MSRVTLRLSGTEVLCREEHPSLLAALESHQVQVEYQCRSGYCGSCRCRLVSGQVDWLTEPLAFISPVSYTHLTLPTIHVECRSRWSPYH